METVNPIDFILVEDNPNDAEMVIRALRKRYPASRHTWLKDGAEALAFLLPSGIDAQPLLENVRLIILDLKLPLIDGFEVLQKLKVDPRTASMPVVIMTSSQEDADVARSYRSGANSYVVKPVSFDEFSSRVAQIGDYWLNVNQPS